MNTNYQKIIENYIKAYNSFEIDKMVADMHDDIRFENISNGEVTLLTNGKAELITQAEHTKRLFESRELVVTGLRFDDDQVEADIEFAAVLAGETPSGLKPGDLIEIKGKSIFRFKENKIIALTDIS